MIKLYALNQAKEELVNISLVQGDIPAPFDKDSKFVPNEKGYSVYVDTNDYKWYQKAARTIASLKVFNFKLTSEKSLSSQEFYWFLIALSDLSRDFIVEYDLDENTLKTIENKVNRVNEFRLVADSDSKVSTPVALVENLFAKIKQVADISGDEVALEIIKRGDKEFESFAGLNAVGFASNQAPCMGIIDFYPKNSKKDAPIDIALVGKGITFDTGGYSLKPDKYMETMRTDKTAVVYLCGALALAIEQGLSKRVRLYLCCSENMVSGQGMLPGDILTYKNGVTVEINNTDAEGRLVLADGLIKACEDKASFILDMATLTGAAKIAVGRDMFSVLTPKQENVTALMQAFNETEEMCWQLPLAPYHQRFLSSRRAKVTNSGHGEGAPGASTAASFLSLFVDKNTPWVHIDLSSAYLPDGSPFLGAGPTGSTILGLSYYLSNR